MGDVKGALQKFMCSITKELAVAPTYCFDGRIYDLPAILEHFSNSAGKPGGIVSPCTGEPMDFVTFAAPDIKHKIDTLILEGAVPKEMCDAYHTACKERMSSLCQAVMDNHVRGHVHVYHVGGKIFVRSSGTPTAMAAWPEIDKLARLAGVSTDDTGGIHLVYFKISAASEAVKWACHNGYPPSQ